MCDCRRARRPCSSRPCASPVPPAAAAFPGLSTPVTWPPRPCPGGHKLPLNFALSDKVKTQHCFITLLCLTKLKDNTASSLCFVRQVEGQHCFISALSDKVKRQCWLSPHLTPHAVLGSTCTPRYQNKHTRHNQHTRELISA